MVPFDPVTAERRGDDSRLSGDRIIDATGMYVMPGIIDAHSHIAISNVNDASAPVTAQIRSAPSTAA